MLILNQHKLWDHLNYGSVLLFSGGLDSAVAAKMLARSGQPPLLVHTHQGFVTHTAAAILLAEKLNLDIIVVDIANAVSALSEFAELNVPGSKMVPGYRALTWTVALSIASSARIAIFATGEYGLSALPTYNPELEYFAGYLSMGKGRVDEANPDSEDELLLSAIRAEGQTYTRQQFSDLFANMATTAACTAHDPLFAFDKAGVIRLGKVLGVPFELTSTCRVGDLDKIAMFSKEYVGKQGLRKYPLSYKKDDKLNCGRANCHFCCTRRASFLLAGVEDPSLYVFDEELPRVHKEEVGV